MATQTLTAYATVADVVDGAAGISILVSNENHTFVANADGAIAATELAAFTTDLQVLVGTTPYAFQAGGALQSGQWKISDGNADGAAAITVAGDLAATVTDVGTDARLVFADADTATSGFVDGGAASPDSVQIVVPIQVQHGSIVRMFNRIIAFSKARGGSASILTLTSTAAVLEYDKAGALKSPADTIVFDAALENIAATAGNVVWEYRLSPTAAWTAVPASAGITRTETQQTRLTFTRQAIANLLTGGAISIQVRATLAGRADVRTIARVQDGADGSAGASVVELRILPRTSTILVNNTGSVIFDARLFYKGVTADAAISGYQWLTRAAGVNTNIAGATAAFREFAAMDAGSGTRLIGCTVSYDDTHATVTG